MSFIARQSFMACRRAQFSTSTAARKFDLVQDLYLRELKAYKAPVKAEDAHVGAVKSYAAPSAPTPPSAPTDLASELSKYDATEPTLADASTASPSPAAQAQGEVGSADAFLAFLEQDIPKAEAHH